MTGGKAETKSRGSGGYGRSANGRHIQPKLLQVLGGRGSGGVRTAMDAMNRTRLGGGVGGDKLADILFQFLAKLISLRRTDNRKRGLRGGGGGGRKSRAKKEGRL